MKYEIQLWVYQILKFLPGRAGAWLRNLMLPYKHGRHVHVMDGVHIDHPSLLSLGNNVSINRGCVINAAGGVTIGDDVMVGPGVIIYSQNHNFSLTGEPFRCQGYGKKATIVGNNVWLAARCIVLPGVTLGDNMVVAAGSVVTKSFSGGQLIAGNPAKMVRQLG